MALYYILSNTILYYCIPLNDMPSVYILTLSFLRLALSPGLGVSTSYVQNI